MSTRNCLFYSSVDIMGKALNAIKQHLIQKTNRLRKILDFANSTPITYFVYNMGDYRNILGDKLFNLFLQQLIGIQLSSQNSSPSELFLEELLEYKFS